MALEIINFESTPSYQIKQLIDKAGFRSITGRQGGILCKHFFL